MIISSPTDKSDALPTTIWFVEPSEPDAVEIAVVNVVAFLLTIEPLSVFTLLPNPLVCCFSFPVW